MKDLLIIGAGDMGREVVTWFGEIDGQLHTWKLKGFLDIDSSRQKIRDLRVPVVGSPEDYEPQEGDVFVCAIGSAEARARVCTMLEARGARFISLVHPSTLVAADAVVGAGCILFPSALVDTKAILQDHVACYFGATIGHGAIVGRWSLVLPQAVVGSSSTLSQGVTVSVQGFTLNGIRVGEFATIGANSVAVRDVPARTTVFGVPARPLKTLGYGQPDAAAETR